MKVPGIGRNKTVALVHVHRHTHKTALTGPTRMHMFTPIYRRAAAGAKRWVEASVWEARCGRSR